VTGCGTEYFHEEQEAHCPSVFTVVLRNYSARFCKLQEELSVYCSLAGTLLEQRL
jgi:hypothetical protein